jgi:hypothetical protein
MSGVKRYFIHEAISVAHVMKQPKFILAADHDAEIDTLRTANQRLEGEVARLREVAREFAGYWSSDNPKHWELHGLADGADYSAALRGNGVMCE